MNYKPNFVEALLSAIPDEELKKLQDLYLEMKDKYPVDQVVRNSYDKLKNNVNSKMYWNNLKREFEENHPGTNVLSVEPSDIDGEPWYEFSHTEELIPDVIVQMLSLDGYTVKGIEVYGDSSKIIGDTFRITNDISKGPKVISSMEARNPVINLAFVVDELPDLNGKTIPVGDRQSILNAIHTAFHFTAQQINS